MCMYTLYYNLKNAFPSYPRSLFGCLIFTQQEIKNLRLPRNILVVVLGCFSVQGQRSLHLLLDTQLVVSDFVEVSHNFLWCGQVLSVGAVLSGDVVLNLLVCWQAKVEWVLVEVDAEESFQKRSLELGSVDGRFLEFSNSIDVEGAPLREEWLLDLVNELVLDTFDKVILLDLVVDHVGGRNHLQL